MGFVFEQRFSDSPYLETVTQGYSVGVGTTIRPAESHWHMVFVRVQGKAHALAVGALPTSGVVPYGGEAEILWVKFKLGTFMPHLPACNLLASEMVMPEATRQSFWLNGSAWQLPNFENIETFINRLVRNGVLVFDPVIANVLQGQPHDLSPRTVRHRFLQATGLAQNNIHQIERAQRAATLLQQGVSILDTVTEAGYFDQPHLTRALKQWVGHTPSQLLPQSQPS